MDSKNISSDFSIDDIHKIRESNHEETKDMSFTEKKAFYKSKADKVKMSLKKETVNF